MHSGKKHSILLALSLSMLVSACGGGSGGEESAVPSTPDSTNTNSNSNSDNTPTEPPESRFELSGKVIDGYVEHAIVFYDTNNNGVLDAGEPQTRSGSDGSFKLELTQQQKQVLKQTPIRALLGDDAVDIDTGELFQQRPALLSGVVSKKGSATEGHVILSPFSTILHDKLKGPIDKLRAGRISTDEFALSWNEAKAELVLSISQTLKIKGINAELLLSDFIQKIASSGEYSDDELTLIREEAVLRTDAQQEQYAMKQEMIKTLKANQHASVSVSFFPFSDWNTGQNMDLKEVNKMIYTESENGDHIVDSIVIKYRTDPKGNVLVDGLDEPMIYEIYKGSVTRKADGTYIETGSWEKDLNQDNVRNFRGQQYKIGTYNEKGNRMISYIDETSVSFDYNGGFDSYDGIDLAEAVANNDFSAIEQAQDQFETTEIIDGARVRTFQFNSRKPQANSIPVYVERRIRTTMPDGEYKEEILRGNGKDGLFSTRQLTTLSPNGTKDITYSDISLPVK